MKQPKISIIVPIYKAEESLRRLLDSFENQPYKDIEFFLIDNASPDKCGEICREYVDRDSRFVLHTLDVNIGYIRARQYGIDNCSGEYVGFSDSDDYVPTDIYSDIVAAIERDDPDFVGCGYARVVDDNIESYHTPLSEGCYRNNQITERVLPILYGYDKGIPFFEGFMWKNFYRKRVCIDNKLSFIEELKPYEDQIYNIDFIKYCNVVTIIDKPVYYYVSNMNSITGQNIKNFNAVEEYTRIDNLEKYKLNRDDKKRFQKYIANDVIYKFYPLFLNVAKNLSKKEQQEFVRIIDSDYSELTSLYATPDGKIHNIFQFFFVRKKYFSLIRFIKLFLKLRG